MQFPLWLRWFPKPKPQRPSRVKVAPADPNVSLVEHRAKLFADAVRDGVS